MTMNENLKIYSGYFPIKLLRNNSYISGVRLLSDKPIDSITLADSILKIHGLDNDGIGGEVVPSKFISLLIKKGVKVYEKNGRELREY